MSKFNKEQKIEIYRKWKDEKISISQLSKTYKTNVANLDYMLRLIDMYGINVLDRPYQVYSKEFKEQAIEQAVFSTKSYVQVSLERVLAHLVFGLENIRKTGIMSLSNRKDALPVIKETQKSRKELEKEIQKLKEENLRLRIVNEYVKKLKALDQDKDRKK